MDILLNDIEIRVLGSLIEKEITTPEYYPLSLNALVNACNQKSNRDPVMALAEDAVREALDSLDEKGLAGAHGGGDSRVTKFEHRLQEVFNFSRPEIAVLCVLFLRGPQTPGELRGRSERMYRFDGLDVVLSALQRLMKREPPLVKVLPRQPATKEARYAHLLAGEIDTQENRPAEESSAAGTPVDAARMARLEQEVASLRNEIEALRKQLADFRK